MDKHLWEEEGREDRQEETGEAESPGGMALQRPQTVEGTDMMRKQGRRWRGAEAELGKLVSPTKCLPYPGFVTSIKD